MYKSGRKRVTAASFLASLLFMVIPFIYEPEICIIIAFGMVAIAMLDYEALSRDINPLLAKVAYTSNRILSILFILVEGSFIDIGILRMLYYFATFVYIYFEFRMWQTANLLMLMNKVKTKNNGEDKQILDEICLNMIELYIGEIGKAYEGIVFRIRDAVGSDNMLAFLSAFSPEEVRKLICEDLNVVIDKIKAGKFESLRNMIT